MGETLTWRLITYSMCLLPVPTLVWSFVRWARDDRSRHPQWRRAVSLGCFILLTASAVLLVLFPEVLELLAGRTLDPADSIYINAIRFGSFSAIAARTLGFVSISSVRLPLTVGVAFNK